MESCGFPTDRHVLPGAGVCIPLEAPSTYLVTSMKVGFCRRIQVVAICSAHHGCRSEWARHAGLVGMWGGTLLIQGAACGF